MSISIEEARRKLDVIEKLSKDPKLILTDLFSEGVDGSNFLYQINIGGIYMTDYLKEYLKTLTMFDDCKLRQSSWIIYVYANSLKCGEYQSFQSDDLIAKINLEDKTYRLFDDCINKYQKIMTEKYEYKEKELADIWKRFIDLTYGKRIRYAIKSFTTKKKPLIKVSDFLFWLFYPISKSKTIQARIREEQKAIDDRNRYELARYNEQLERQKLYLEEAPRHIGYIKIKHSEIAKYLCGLGYKEDLNMSEYY